MNIQQAREALKQGHKVTHKYFTENEHLTYGEEGLQTEDGYGVNWFNYKNNPDFEEGWEIKEISA